jgi:GxxExxY protein
MLKHEEVTEAILGVFYQVYNELGPGFLESVYLNSMAIALAQAGLHVEKEKAIVVRFRNQRVGEFRADLVVNEKVICELKASSALDPVFEAQLLNYLRATEIEVGLLLNFGPEPQPKRLVFDNARKKSVSIRENPRQDQLGG